MDITLSQDVEKMAEVAQLTNDSIQSLSWEGITVTVKDRQSKQPREILTGANGIVKAGEMVALMGPSGSGKTTLLNVLAHREATRNATVLKSIHLNGAQSSLSDFRAVSAYVEQEDALLGSLTVYETLHFASQLSLPSSISKAQRIARITSLISSFGLQEKRDTLIGTPIRKGLSGGQKRRVSVAAQLITSPQVLFLDEPTSGLDSYASFEVMNSVRDIAKKYKILVIASIHQPSTSTFELFDKLILLSGGNTVYNGSLRNIQDYFANLNYPIPLYTNPAEHLIQLINTDFTHNHTTLSTLISSWTASPAAKSLTHEIATTTSLAPQSSTSLTSSRPNPLTTTLTLIHRSFLKSHRDILTYGLRLAMYLGLAIMMGTVWLRLPAVQSSIPAFTNAIFFGGAFMSFMAVAYIPAYLEDLHLYTQERSNGLYGPTSFMLANFVVGVPYLFVIAVLFSVVAYWLSNFRPQADGFWIWVMWLFLDLLAAESLVVFLSSAVPIFVVALAATAFANGLWMCVNGFMVQPETLNVFWRYVFHYIDYQAYVFRGMMVNEFGYRSYDCGEGCRCMFASELEGMCRIDGNAVLASYGYGKGNLGRYVGYMLVITLVYRLLGWMVLLVRKH